MAFREILDLDCDTTVALGGFNKKLRTENPTSIEGYFLGSKVVASPKSKDGKAKLHIFQTAEGNVGVWGKTDLDRKMTSVQLGAMTKASFSGMAPSKNGEMYKYKVAQDSENTIDVDTSPKNTPVLVEASASEEESYGDDEDSLDDEVAEEIPAPRPIAPKVPAKTPSSEQQAKIQALLSKNRK